MTNEELPAAPRGWVLVRVGASRSRVARPDQVVGGVWCPRCRTNAASLDNARTDLCRLRAEGPQPEGMA